MFVISEINTSGKHQKEKAGFGMTLHRLTMDILAQTGLRAFGISARYSPVSIFEKYKGPE